MTRIEPVGNTLQSFSAAVAGADNQVSEQELTENGLPQSIPQLGAENDPATSSTELAAYLQGMADAHQGTVTISNADYAVVGPDGQIVEASKPRLPMPRPYAAWYS